MLLQNVAYLICILLNNCGVRHDINNSLFTVCDRMLECIPQARECFTSPCRDGQRVDA